MRIKYIFFFTVMSTTLAAQNLQSIYLMCKYGSKELCDVVKSRQGNFYEHENVLKYHKYEMSKGRIGFHICSELFVHYKGKIDKKVLSNDFLKSAKLMEYEELAEFLNKMQDKYPFGPRYPNKKYPKLYIPIRISNSEICLYEVRWVNYFQ